jgi:hypothetical protein
MRFGLKFLPVVLLGLAISSHAQVAQEARYSILGTMIATEGAARIPMPLGGRGVDLSENGLIDNDRLQKELADNGAVITAGKIVLITGVEFHDDSIEFEIDGGGTKKKGFLSSLSNIQIGIGGGVNSQDQKQEEQAKGSKITLMFADKVPPNVTPDELKTLLSPVLDFSKQTLARTAIDALPLEFQEAVKAKEARIGMDANTVLLALGQPNRRVIEKNSEGVEQEDWIYTGRGRRQTFVTFENDVVVSIRQY